MKASAFFALAVLALPTVLSSAPASAAPTIITQQKALAGGVTPNDDPGYPVTLSRSGSYVLGGNLNVPPNKVGIDVKAHDMTIDGAGYRINGVAPGKASVGIQIGAFNAVTIINVTIVWFKNFGITASAADSLTLDNVRILTNGAYGVYTRDLAHIRKSNVSLNGLGGIACRHSCVVENNVISGNGQPGTGEGVLLTTGNVRENMFRGNRTYAIWAWGDAGASENVMIDNNPGGAQIGSGVKQFGFNLCGPNPNCTGP